MKSVFLLLLVFSCSSICAAQQSVSAGAQDETVAMSTEVVKLYAAGKYSEAEAKARSVVEIREKNLGKNHLSLANSWRNLAYIEMAMKDLKGAETAFDRALDILEANRPLASRDEIMLAEMLEAAAYFDINNNTLGKSEDRLMRAVEIRERLEGNNSEKLVDPLRTLGRIRHGRGEYEKALPFLSRALEIRYKKAQSMEKDDLLLRETAICSLRKLEREDEARELESKFKSSTVGGPGIPKDGTIAAGVINGKALYLAKPGYPREARAKGDQGTVSVKVLISEEGNVIFACAVSGAKTLRGATEVSAYQSKFSPTILKGQPVKVTGVVTYNFKY